MLLGFIDLGLAAQKPIKLSLVGLAFELSRRGFREHGSNKRGLTAYSTYRVLCLLLQGSGLVIIRYHGFPIHKLYRAFRKGGPSLGSFALVRPAAIICN